LVHAPPCFPTPPRDHARACRRRSGGGVSPRAAANTTLAARASLVAAGAANATCATCATASGALTSGPAAPATLPPIPIRTTLGASLSATSWNPAVQPEPPNAATAGPATLSATRLPGVPAHRTLAQRAPAAARATYAACDPVPAGSATAAARHAATAIIAAAGRAAAVAGWTADEPTGCPAATTAP